MGSPITHRTRCPECGFDAAHVKESPKCLYRFCPDCGSQYHARTESQRKRLLEKSRPIDGAPTPPTSTQAPAPEPEAKPTPTPTPTPAPKRRGLF